MNAELKSLIEDAAKLLGYRPGIFAQIGLLVAVNGEAKDCFYFNPRDPERGDLMKVAMAAELCVNHNLCWTGRGRGEVFYFAKDDHDSLALAVLRAASAVLKARNGNET